MENGPHGEVCRPYRSRGKDTSNKKSLLTSRDYRAREEGRDTDVPNRLNLRPASVGNLLLASRRCHNYIAGSVMVRALAATGLAALMACTGITEPRLPLAERFDPPAQYLGWWREMEECSARTGRFDAVSFYRVLPTPGRDSLQFRDPKSGQYHDGEWVSRSNAIYVAAGRLLDPGLVRHEMLHALLRDAHHPPGYFAGLCARLVAY